MKSEKKIIDPRITANTIKNHDKATFKEKRYAERFLAKEVDNKGILRSIQTRLEKRK